LKCPVFCGNNQINLDLKEK